MAALEQATRALSEDSKWHLQQARRDLSKAVTEFRHSSKAESQATQATLQVILTKLDALSQAGSAIATQEAILASLHFDEMPMRQIQIPEAYPETNKWMFHDQESPFKNWLEHTQDRTGVFWICGKAGSGKSTLVKFLASNEETQRILGSDVVVSSFYFWKAGYEMQKSLQGLLQYLLYSIFRR